jgi:hypothetical protein
MEGYLVVSSDSEICMLDYLDGAEANTRTGTCISKTVPLGISTKQEFINK